MTYGPAPVASGSYALRAAAGGKWGRWTWRAQDGACEECEDLDGSSYDDESDVPERPHPNCRCEIENVIQAEHRDKWYAQQRRRGRHPGAWKKPKHRRKKPRKWTRPKSKPGRPKKKKKR